MPSPSDSAGFMAGVRKFCKQEQNQRGLQAVPGHELTDPGQKRHTAWIRSDAIWRLIGLKYKYWGKKEKLTCDALSHYRSPVA